MADLTAVRGCFALWVFFFHTNLHLHLADLEGPVGRGYLGVDGFFILSGLVLAHRHPQLSLSPRALGRFWWRRFVRLYPTVLAMLALLGSAYLLARAAGVHPHQAMRAAGREYLLQLLLLNGLGFSRGWTWNYPSWSISTEWVGYLLFPLLVAVVARLGPRSVGAGVAAMAALLLAVAWASPVGLNLSYQGALPRFLPEFASGILLARLLACARMPPASVSVAAALLLIAAGIWLRRHALAGDALVAFGLWFLLAALASAPRPWLARCPGLLPLGALSYPFYMAYASVEILAARLWLRFGDPAQRPLLWLGLLFLGTLALAWVTARLIERPALRHLAGRRPDG
ncbi:acyltransferase family protein [Acidisoma sp. 7E03]